MAAPAPPPGGDKKNIVKMAYIYFQEGRWDKAIEEYKKLLALDPEDINAHNMLGDVYVKKGAVREAYLEYVKVSDDFSSRGQQEKAAIVNKKIAALDTEKLPSDAQQKQALIRQISRAEAAMEQEDLDAAVEAYKGILKLDPENLQAHGKLAEILTRKGDNKEAVAHFLEVGTVFVKNRLYKKAQEIFQKVVELDPSNSEARASLAQIYIKQGSESDAKKEYLNLAEASFNEGDLDKAQQYSSKAIEFKSIEAHYILGLVLLKKKKYAEAKSEFENLLRFKVNHVGALTNLGMVYIEQNQLDKANECIQKAAKTEKNNPRTLEVLAEFHIRKNAKIEAVATLLSLTDLYADKKELEKAAETALKAIGVDGTSLQAHIKLAEMYRLSGAKEKAAEVFAKTAALFDAQNKKDQAEEYYKKAADLDPNCPELKKREGAPAAPAPAAPPPPPAAAAPASAAPAVPAPAPPPAAPPVKGEVLDLEKDLGEAPPPAAPVVEKPEPPKAPAMDPEAEFKAQLEIADNLLKQNLVEEAIEAYQQLVEQYPDKAQARERLNKAYTVYVKTGDEVIDALEAEKKQREEEDRRTRSEMEKRIRAEAEKKVQAEVERKARETAEKKAREEAERKAREEAERKVREEAERKAREEAEKKVREETEKKAREAAEKKSREEAEKKAREEAEKKAREEAEKKAREEAEKKAKEAAAKAKPAAPHSPKPGAPPEDAKDEFMTIAVADIYVRQGLHDEARKIYEKILLMEPDNFEARKKLTDLDNHLKPKSAASEQPPPAPSAPSGKPSPSAPTAPPAPSHDKETSKKRSGKVGYV